MKKSFLIVSALGAIIATNGYAVQSGGVGVTLKCPDGCVLYTSQSGGNFEAYCYNPSTYKMCSGPTVNNFGMSADVMREIKKMEELDKTNATKQTKKTNTARAAKIGKNVNTADIPSTPMGATEKASVGSGETVVTCPSDCKLDCKTNGLSTVMICRCRTPNGELCQETTETFEPTIHK
ncbi:MAG: hypothetical protein ACLRFF_03475 [Alphaproteobacteria bacterium]